MRGFSIFRLAVLLAVMAVAACGTVLDVQPDGITEPVRDGGPFADGEALVDGSGPFADFEAGDASTACALSVDHKTVDFGDVLFADTKSEVVTVTSVSPDPVTVGIAVTPGDFGAVGSSVVVPSNPSGATFTIEYTANNNGPQTGTATLTWDSCRIDIPLSAKTLPAGSVAVSPATLNLGAVACGTMPNSGDIVIQTASAVGWTASITAGPFNVPSNGTATPPSYAITVGAAPLLPMNDPREFTADVTLTVEGTAHVVHVTATSLGGKLAFVPNDVTLLKSQPSRAIALTNTGTQAVQVVLAIDPPFKIVETTKGINKVTILPGQSQSVTVSSTAVGPATATATVTQNAGILCAAGPLTVRQQ